MKILNHVAFLILGIILLAAVSTHEFSKRPERNELLVPPTAMKYFALGYNEVLADSLWIRVIQDFDSCGREQSTPSPMPQEVVNAKLEQRIGRCELSWVYRMIDAITDLAPKFRAPYSDGGVILSVTVDDIQGAAHIYNKAVIQYPNDWVINYKAAYHFLYEMGDKERAAELLLAAKKSGGPFWLDVLAARLYSKSGKALLGKQVLEDFLAANPDKADHPHIKQRMAEIERDLAAGDDAPAPAKTAQ